MAANPYQKLDDLLNGNKSNNTNTLPQIDVGNDSSDSDLPTIEEVQQANPYQKLDNLLNTQNIDNHPEVNTQQGLNDLYSQVQQGLNLPQVNQEPQDNFENPGQMINGVLQGGIKKAQELNDYATEQRKILDKEPKSYNPFDIIPNIFNGFGYSKNGGQNAADFATNILKGLGNFGIEAAKTPSVLGEMYLNEEGNPLNTLGMDSIKNQLHKNIDFYENLQQNPLIKQNNQNIPSSLGYGIGNLLGFIPTIFTGGEIAAASKLPAVAGRVGAMAGLETSGMKRNLVNQGVPEDKADTISRAYGTGAGLLFELPIANAVSKFIKNPEYNVITGNIARRVGSKVINANYKLFEPNAEKMIKDAFISHPVDLGAKMAMTQFAHNIGERKAGLKTPLSKDVLQRGLEGAVTAPIFRLAGGQKNLPKKAEVTLTSEDTLAQNRPEYQQQERIAQGENPALLTDNLSKDQRVNLRAKNVKDAFTDVINIDQHIAEGKDINGSDLTRERKREILKTRKSLTTFLQENRGFIKKNTDLIDKVTPAAYGLTGNVSTNKDTIYVDHNGNTYNPDQMSELNKIYKNQNIEARKQQQQQVLEQTGVSPEEYNQHQKSQQIQQGMIERQQSVQNYVNSSSTIANKYGMQFFYDPDYQDKVMSENKDDSQLFDNWKNTVDNLKEKGIFKDVFNHINNQVWKSASIKKQVLEEQKKQTEKQKNELIKQAAQSQLTPETEQQIAQLDDQIIRINNRINQYEGAKKLVVGQNFAENENSSGANSDKMSQDELTPYQKNYKNTAYDILTQATGKSQTWLRSKLESSSDKAITQKNRETIRELIENSEDNLTHQFKPEWSEYFGQFDPNELNSGTEYAKKALDAIDNKSWDNPLNEDDLINQYHNDEGSYLENQEAQQGMYEILSSDANGIFYKNMKGESKEDIDKAYREAYNYIYNNAPENTDPDYIAKAYEDLDNEYNEALKLSKNEGEQSQGSQQQTVPEKSGMGSKRSNQEESKATEGSSKADSAEQDVTPKKIQENIPEEKDGSIKENEAKSLKENTESKTETENPVLDSPQENKGELNGQKKGKGLLDQPSDEVYNSQGDESSKPNKLYLNWDNIKKLKQIKNDESVTIGEIFKDGPIKEIFKKFSDVTIQNKDFSDDPLVKAGVFKNVNGKSGIKDGQEYIYINANNLSDDQLQNTLIHELGHIGQRRLALNGDKKYIKLFKNYKNEIKNNNYHNNLLEKEANDIIVETNKCINKGVNYERSRLLQRIILRSNKPHARSRSDLELLNGKRSKINQRSSKQNGRRENERTGLYSGEPKDLLNSNFEYADYEFVNDYDQKGQPQPERESLKTESQQNREKQKQELLEKIKEIESAKDVLPALKQAARDYYTNIDLKHFDTQKNINDLSIKINDIAKRSGKKDITGSKLKEIAPFLRQRTDFPPELAKDRPDLKKVWDGLTPDKKQELTSEIDKAMELSEKLRQEYNELNTDMPIGCVENYLTQIWDIDKKDLPLAINYFSTSSRFAKQRSIESYYQGIQGITLENGKVIKFKPKTLDITKIMSAHAQSLITAIEGKKFADYAGNLKNKDGLPVVLRADQAPTTWVYIDHPALRKAVFIKGDINQGEKISSELQNKLAELGVAIGRRINPKSHAAGMYRPGTEPPEIRLKRWFSNKTIAHEVGHALDEMLGLGRDFFNRHENELYALNEKRIEAFMQTGDYKLADYAESHEEQIAELFGFMFNDPEFTRQKAPSAMAEALSRMAQNEKIAKLLPENFDWSKAKNMVEEVNNTMFKLGVKVHPDIAKVYNDIFENYKPGNFMKFYDAANNMQKTLDFGLSGFHGYALFEKAFPLIPGKAMQTLFDPREYIKNIRDGKYDVYEKNDLSKDLIKHGLKLEAPQDAPRQQVEKLLNGLADTLEKESRKADSKKLSNQLKILSSAVRITSEGSEVGHKVLWNYLHNNFKFHTANRLISIELDRYKGKNLSSKDISDIKKEVCQFVNDVFGGQAWHILGLTRRGQRTAGRVLKSFDWFTSTIREFAGMLSTGKGQKLLNYVAEKNNFFDNLRGFTRKLGVSSITDSEIGGEIRGRRARRFWMKALIYWSVLYTVANVATRLWDAKNHPELYKHKKPLDYTMLGNDNGKETYIFGGREKSGRETYVREGKAYREVPEIVTEPLTKTGSKLALIGNLFEIFTDQTASGFKVRDLQEKKDWEKVPALIMEMVKSYVPYSVQGMLSPDKEWHVINLIMPTSTGETITKAIEDYKKASEKKDWKKIDEITDSLMMNKINAQRIADLSMRKGGWKPDDGWESKLRQKMKADYQDGKNIGNSRLAQKVKKSVDEDKQAIHKQEQNPDELKKSIKMAFVENKLKDDFKHMLGIYDSDPEEFKKMGKQIVREYYGGNAEAFVNDLQNFAQNQKPVK